MEYLEGKHPEAVAFQLPDKTARMLRADLDDARAAWVAEAKTKRERKNRDESSFLKYADDAGQVADFHALRHTFVTALCLAGTHPKTVQDLARHSDINLTMSRYTHTVLADRAKAVEALPDIQGKPGNQRMRATGTNDPGRGPEAKSLPSSIPAQGTSCGMPLTSPDHESGIRRACQRRGNSTGLGAGDNPRQRVSSSGTTAPRWIRTSNLRFRRPMLYPIELAALCSAFRRRNTPTRCQ